jgi:hypothetical protein
LLQLFLTVYFANFYRTVVWVASTISRRNPRSLYPLLPPVPGRLVGGWSLPALLGVPARLQQSTASIPALLHCWRGGAGGSRSATHRGICPPALHLQVSCPVSLLTPILSSCLPVPPGWLFRLSTHLSSCTLLPG